MLALLSQMVEQPAVGRVDGAPSDELVDLRPQASGLGDQHGRLQGAGVVGVP